MLTGKIFALFLIFLVGSIVQGFEGFCVSVTADICSH